MTSALLEAALRTIAAESDPLVRAELAGLLLAVLRPLVPVPGPGPGAAVSSPESSQTPRAMSDAHASLRVVPPQE